jgi:hypothetical protein
MTTKGGHGSMSEEKQDFWAVVEVMGHKVFPGRVSDQAFGSASFIRVDVPEVPERTEKQTGYDTPDGSWGTYDATLPGAPAYTKIIGPGSIYCITPCTEEVARQVAAQRRERPVDVIDISRPVAMRSLSPGAGDDEEYDL